MSNIVKFVKRDIAQEITDSVITALETGTAPWVKPWNTIGEAVPNNPVSKTHYRGINFMWLMMSGNGYATNRWVTAKQGASVNARIRKGETGMPVIFWKKIKVTDKDSPANADGSQPTKEIPYMKHYTVFNLDQFDPAGELSEADTIGTLYPSDDVDRIGFEPHEYTDSVVEQTGANVQIGGNTACFIPAKDQINMPKAEMFNSVEDYYSTLLHELTHWTGHKDRLDRLTGDKFGGKGYAFEELIAELGAAMLCCQCGIEGQLQHSAYIASWLKVLKEDKKAIIKAAGFAQRAMDHVLAYGEKQENAAA